MKIQTIDGISDEQMFMQAAFKLASALRDLECLTQGPAKCIGSLTTDELEKVHTMLRLTSKPIIAAANEALAPVSGFVR